VLSSVRDHRDRLAIVAGDDPEQWRMAVGMKRYALADLEIEHLRMRAHMAQKSQPLDDSVVQVDEFRFAELFDIDFHLGLRLLSICLYLMRA